MSNSRPKGWALVRVGDACRLVNGRAFKPSDWTENGLPIIRIQNLNNPKAPFNRYHGPVEERFRVSSGELLFAWSGTPGTSFGAHVWHGGDAILNQHIFRVLDYETLYERDFLRLAINDQLAHLIGVAHGGAGLAHVTKPVFESTELALPPLREQRRIVAKLESLQSRSRRAREALDAVPPLLEKLRQSILAAAFRGDLTKDWRAKHKDVEPASVLLTRIRAERRKKWEEAELAKLKAKGKPPTDDRWKAKYKEPEPVDESGLPALPQGWCWASVDELSNLQLGQQRAPIHAAAEETHPYVRAANITWSGLDLSDVKRMGFPDPDRYRLVPGDVLLSEASGSATEVGKPAIWRGEIPDCCYQKTLLRARPVSAEVLSEWLHLNFLADALLGRFARMAPGVGILHLTADRMLSWPVALAPLAEQTMLIERTDEALTRVARLEDAGRTLYRSTTALDQAILAKAFRGELVPQDPSDEPADIILARLRATAESDKESGPRARRRRAG